MPSSRRQKKRKPKPGVNGKGTKIKLSTMLLVVLALVGCVFSIGVLLGALALNQEQEDEHTKHAYNGKTTNNVQIDPALAIPHSPPNLPGAQANGVRKTVTQPLPSKRDLVTPIETNNNNNNKPTLLASKTKAVVHPNEVDLSSPVVATASATKAAVSTPPNTGTPPTPPPPATPTNPGVPMKIHRDYSFQLDGENWIDVVDPLDAAKQGTRAVDIAVTAWIWLDPKDKGDHMKTIFANRVAGCDVSADR